MNLIKSNLSDICRVIISAEVRTMDDVFVYFVKMPAGMHEAVVPCLDGYTVYIDSSLSGAEQLKAYVHAIRHIESSDWEKHDVNQIEADAHRSA